MSRGILLGMIMLSVVIGGLKSQANHEAERLFDSAYAVRIMLEEINGVYIPFDENDAIQEVIRLSSQADLDRFKQAEEVVIRDKLHFGLGRWMIYNWGFYEGSRLSHHLKEMGLEHPDDMAKFMLVSLHRHLNGKEIDAEAQVRYFFELREKERAARDSARQIIYSETRKRKNNQK